MKAEDVVVKFKGVELKGCVEGPLVVVDAGVGELAERWRELVAKTKVGGALPITFQVYFGKIDIIIVASMLAPQRDKNISTMINVTKVVLGEPEASVLRELARDLYLHELDEWFLVDGVRVFDPHVRFVNRDALRMMDGAG